MNMHTDPSHIHLEHGLIRDVQLKSNWFTGLAIVFMALGVLAIIFPWVAAISFELVIGALFLVAGIAQAIHAVSIRRWKGFGMNLALAIVALLTGGLMLFYPIAGVITLTTMVVVFFLLSGSIKTAFALRVRPAHGWGWILTSGLLSLVLGVLILIQLAAAMPWILGLLLGLDFLFSGFWILMLAIKARQFAE